MLRVAVLTGLSEEHQCAGKKKEHMWKTLLQRCAKEENKGIERAVESTKANQDEAETHTANTNVAVLQYRHV